jgi:hypothetical protein
MLGKAIVLLDVSCRIEDVLACCTLKGSLVFKSFQQSSSNDSALHDEHDDNVHSRSACPTCKQTKFPTSLDLGNCGCSYRNDMSNSGTLNLMLTFSDNLRAARSSLFRHCKRQMFEKIADMHHDILQPKLLFELLSTRC